MDTKTLTPEPKSTKPVASGPIVLRDIFTQPITLTSKNGLKKMIIKLDDIQQTENQIHLSIWCTHDGLKFCLASPTSAIPCEISEAKRVDTKGTVSKASAQTTVYGVTAKIDSALPKETYLTFGFDGSLYAYKLPTDGSSGFLCDISMLALGSSTKSKAHIDLCGAIPGKIGSLSGWSIAKPGVKLWLVDTKGNTKDLSNCLRYHRDDVAKIFKNEFSSQIPYAGFVTDWPYPQDPTDKIAVVENDGGNLTVIALNSWTIIADDPVNYAEFSFKLATPAQDFNTRLNSWEGDVLNSLLFEKQLENKRNEQPARTWHYGRIASGQIETSLIIPLYGRWDFVEHQLSAFAKDPIFKERAELIYVIDDPALINAFVNEAESLYKLYQVPFSIIWGHRNRGFSGANNLGVKHSQGETLILLNSDVFPRHIGWVDSLTKCLHANPEYGMIGAKLLFPDGGIQHCGMEFVYSESWSVWLNKHPLAGLDPVVDQSTELTEKPAITGACVAIKRGTYDQIDGLDEGYLIGDFEDSDLCLKVHAAGLKVGYLPTVVLTHLERQSFTLLGDVSYRTLVVRFNAWRHTKKWGKNIEQIMKKFKPE